MSDCVLVLIVNKPVEESLSDWLLELEELPMFASEPIDCHGLEHHRLNLAEQVAGRQRKVMFQIRTELAEARRIVTRLRQDFAGAGLAYWITPVLEHGTFD